MANSNAIAPAATREQIDGRDTHDADATSRLQIARTAVAQSGTQYAIVRSLSLGRNTLHFSTLLIIMLGFALRLYALAHESLWFDELLQLDIAQGPLAGILPQLPRHTAVPLDYLLTHFWILLGRQDDWVRLPAVVFGTLTLPLAYQLGRTLLGKNEGLLLLLLLAVSPFHVHYSQEARPYTLVVLGVILAGYALWRFRTTGRRRFLVMLPIGVLIFALAHLFALAIFGPFLLWAAADFIWGAERRRAARSLIALAGAGFVSLVILFALGYGGALFYSTREFGKAVVEPEKFTAEAEQKPNRGAGPQLDEYFFKTELLGSLGAGDSEPVLWLFNGLVGLGFLYLLTRKRYDLSFLLLLWLLLPIVAIVAFLIFRGTFFAPRYIISTLPAYLVLLTAGIFALPRWLKCAEPAWVSKGAWVVLSGAVLLTSALALNQLYTENKNEDWRLVARFLTQNARPDDAVITVNAESTMNWYYPPAQAEPDSFDNLAAIQARVAQARRSWVIVSIFSNYIGDEVLKIRAWLGEQGAIRMVFDPVIDVYYLGPTANPPELLQEIQGMALPVNHALYASLARENRRDPAVARRYYELALANAPDDETRAEYQAALNALNGSIR